jgi:hypothetical protein
LEIFYARSQLQEWIKFFLFLTFFQEAKTCGKTYEEVKNDFDDIKINNEEINKIKKRISWIC